MKPPPFDYVLVRSLEEAVQALSAAKGDGRIIAGGQSLLPLLNFRMTRPSILIDINGIEGLSIIEDRGDRIAIGALTRHHILETSPIIAQKLPVLSAAMKHVAHLAIRNRGTIGGSLSHADPAAELPMMAIFHDATIKVVGGAGKRDIRAADFFIAALTTALEPEEIVYEVEFPVLARHKGWSFEEVARRSGDFALACVAVSLELETRNVRDARLAIMGVSETAIRIPEAEHVLRGRNLDDDDISDVIELVQKAISPNKDIHGSEEYRRHLASALTRSALTMAWSRATGERH